MNMSDVRDTTTQGSRLLRKPLKKKKQSHSIESILVADGDKFCPGSKIGNKLQGLAPSFWADALNVLLTWLRWVHGIHALCQAFIV